MLKKKEKEANQGQGVKRKMAVEPWGEWPFIPL